MEHIDRLGLERRAILEEKISFRKVKGVRGKTFP